MEGLASQHRRLALYYLDNRGTGTAFQVRGLIRNESYKEESSGSARGRLQWSGMGEGPSSPGGSRLSLTP